MKSINLSNILSVGNLWEKGAYKRTYFNDRIELLETLGFQINFYNTGNVSSAYDADGEKISNSKAREILGVFDKIYYDHNRKCFAGRGCGKINIAEICNVEIVDDVNAEESQKQDTENKWSKIKVNVQNIKHETARAYLIAMPHSSDYDGFEFWVSKKLVRAGSHDYEVSVSIADDMKFNLKRTSPKTFKVLEECEIGAEEMMAAFDKFHGVKAVEKAEEVVTHVPEKLEPVEAEADASLIR